MTDFELIIGIKRKKNATTLRKIKAVDNLGELKLRKI